MERSLPQLTLSGGPGEAAEGCLSQVYSRETGAHRGEGTF